MPSDTTAQKALRTRLPVVAAARVKLKADYAAGTKRLAATILEAREAGIPITEIAEIVGVTRQTIYNLLGSLR